MQQQLENSTSTNFDIAAEVERLRVLIDRRLGELIPECSTPSRAARHSSLAPGKRLRAIMTILAGRQFGADEKITLDVACAIEMIHTASLIFDDLPAMDDAGLRRGVATAHVAYGEGVAILAGIGLLNGAFDVVSSTTDLSDQQQIEIVRVFSTAIGWNGLVKGQALDLQSELSDPAGSVEDIHRGKTGVLFEAAVLAGAICGNGSTEAQDRMRRYGECLGLAYQAFDDVLDQMVSAEVAGKPTQQDTGKHTAISTDLDKKVAVQRAISEANNHLLNAAESVIDESKQANELASLAQFIGTYFERAFSMAEAD